MHCTFCPSDYLKRDKRNADDALAIEFIVQVRDLDLNRPIQFSVLGEPLLNKKIFKYIDLCEQYGISVYLISNFAILDAERARSIFRHHNVALVLSLQTPTEDSYKRLRGYDKLTFEQYFDRILPALRENFIQRSQSRIEVHVSSTSNMRADSTIQSDFELTMWDPFSIDDKEAFVRGLLDLFDGFSEQLRAEFPEQFEAERLRSEVSYKEQLDSGHLSAQRATVPADVADLTEDRFWGYMFAPNCFVRFKTFGLWTKEQSFMKTFLPKESLLYVEDREEALDCSLAHNVSMLADGQMSLCCLDYEGEMGMPNLRETSIEELMRSPERLAIAKYSMKSDICRRCQGNLFVFDTRPDAGTSFDITKFGRGWYPHEREMHGSGGRWSNGNAFTYYFSREQANLLSLRLLSPHDDASALSALVRKYDEATKEFGEARPLPFAGVKDQVVEVDLAYDFEAGKLYRIDLVSPTFVPAEKNGGADERKLGIALLSAQVRRVSAEAAVSTQSAVSAEAATPPLTMRSPGRFASFMSKLLG